MSAKLHPRFQKMIPIFMMMSLVNWKRPPHRGAGERNASGLNTADCLPGLAESFQDEANLGRAGLLRYLRRVEQQCSIRIGWKNGMNAD